MNIYPQETEDVLITHPDVADVAVFGVPNEEMGEEVKAVVQPHDMAKAGKALEAELILFCRKHLSPIKCPKSIDFEAELPRTPTGKLVKRHLRDRYWPKAGRRRKRSVRRPWRKPGPITTAGDCFTKLELQPFIADRTFAGDGSRIALATLACPGREGRERRDAMQHIPPRSPAPAGIRSRYCRRHQRPRMHVLEAGFETKGRPCLLLLHGFPELAYSWRKVMPAARGGRLSRHRAGPARLWPHHRLGRATTTATSPRSACPIWCATRSGWSPRFGYRTVDAVIGHDFGSSVAAWCALIRPDVFRSVAMMSAPFGGPPPLPFNTADGPAKPATDDPVHRELAALPRPRKHYQWYYSTRKPMTTCTGRRRACMTSCAPITITRARTGKPTRRIRCKSWSAGELAKLPTYYIMDLAEDMAATVAEEMPIAAEIAANTWLPDSELAVYAAEYQRNGFQGGLQWYRCGTSGAFVPELQLWSGRTIDVPSAFISGKQDWGTYQRPGVYEAMQKRACSNMIGCHLVDGAGHWVQQEQPKEVSRLLLGFLREAGKKS